MNLSGVIFKRKISQGPQEGHINLPSLRQQGCYGPIVASISVWTAITQAVADP